MRPRNSKIVPIVFSVWMIGVLWFGALSIDAVTVTTVNNAGCDTWNCFSNGSSCLCGPAGSLTPGAGLLYGCAVIGCSSGGASFQTCVTPPPPGAPSPCKAGVTGSCGASNGSCQITFIGGTGGTIPSYCDCTNVICPMSGRLYATDVPSC